MNMRIMAAVAVLMAGTASPTLAQHHPGNNGGGHGGCGVGQQTNGCGGTVVVPTPGPQGPPGPAGPPGPPGAPGTGGAGGSGGAGVGIGVGIADADANASAAANAAAIAAQQQGQIQGQQQGQVATGGNATANGGNSSSTSGVLASGNSAILGSGNSDNDIRNTVSTGAVTNTLTGGVATIQSGAVRNDNDVDVDNDINNDNRNTNTNTVGGSNATVGNVTGGALTLADGAVRGGTATTGAITNTNTGGSVGNVSTGASTSNASTGASTSSVGPVNNSANNSSNNSSTNAASGNVTNVSTVNKTARQYRNVATAYAPTVVGAGGSDSCLGSMSGGASTGLFGISLGGTKKDEACRTIKLSRRAEELGMPDVACQILGLDPKFAEGLKRAGRDCSMSNFAGRMVPVSSALPTIPVGDAAVPPQPVHVDESPVHLINGPERG